MDDIAKFGSVEPAPAEVEQFPEAAPACNLSVVLAAYNEEACIVEELKLIKKALDESPFSYEVIVVDDGSSDNTAALVAGFDWVKLLRHRVNQGSGAARKTGTLAAVGEFVLWSDVDLTYPNERMADLLQYLSTPRPTRWWGRGTAKGALLNCCACRPSFSSANWPVFSPAVNFRT